MPSISLMSRLWPFLLVLCVLAFVTFPTLEGIVTRWLKWDESYSHGLLLAGVSLYLIWRKAKANPVAPPGFAPPVWVLPLIACLLAYWVGGGDSSSGASAIGVGASFVCCLRDVNGGVEPGSLVHCAAEFAVSDHSCVGFPGLDATGNYCCR